MIGEKVIELFRVEMLCRVIIENIVAVHLRALHGGDHHRLIVPFFFHGKTSLCFFLFLYYRADFPQREYPIVTI
jgi:hypothetical protein